MTAPRYNPLHAALGLPAAFAETAQSRSSEQQQRQALLHWLDWDNVAAVPLTLTFKSKLHCRDSILRLSDTESVNSLRHLENVLNEKAFGRRFRGDKKRLKSIFFKEFGFDRGLHLHGKIELPRNLSKRDFEKLVVETWRSMDWGNYVHVGQEAGRAWDIYMMKWKSTGQISDHIVLV